MGTSRSRQRQHRSSQSAPLRSKEPLQVCYTRIPFKTGGLLTRGVNATLLGLSIRGCSSLLSSIPASSGLSYRTSQGHTPNFPYEKGGARMSSGSTYPLMGVLALLFEPSSALYHTCSSLRLNYVRSRLIKSILLIFDFDL